MKPQVGTIVHYVSHGTPVRSDGTQAFKGHCRAAIVTTAEDPVVLCVLNPTGIFFHWAEYDEDGAGGTWHWMDGCER